MHAARSKTATGWTQRGLDPVDVARVRGRLDHLERALRDAMDDPSRAHLDAVIDAARWTRFDVDGALAFKGHVPDLRDASWRALSPPANVDAACITFERFVSARPTSWDLVAMRNLRARLDGLIATARGSI
jgi:hypothetical protein